MKRKLLLFCGIAVMTAIFTTGTFAYFTTSKAVEIPVTAGNVELKINEETATGEKITDDEIVIMPGDEVSRIVSVENIGGHPFYTRVKVTKTVENSDLSVEELVELNIDEENWTYKDGYYYYNHKISVGETTEPLFTQVEISGDMDNNYLGKTLKLSVNSYAVQSENNYDNPQNAVGWSKE